MLNCKTAFDCGGLPVGQTIKTCEGNHQIIIEGQLNSCSDQVIPYGSYHLRHTLHNSKNTDLHVGIRLEISGRGVMIST